MKEIRTETTIDASAQTVWRILTDFDLYPQWNPFIREISGMAAPGGKIEATLQPTQGKSMRIRPTVLEADAPREIRWKGHLGIPGIFDGEHAFTIEAIDADHVRFSQRETFTGVLAGPLLKRWGEATQEGFQAMNEALKKRAETEA